jgi:hypothetical protein
MHPAKPAKHEQARSARLKRTVAVAPASDGLLDEVSRLVTEASRTKVSPKISSSRLSVKQRLWIKAKSGINRAMFVRENAFHVIESKSSVLSAIIADTASPILDSEGKTMGVVLVFNDEAMQRQMAQELSYR